MRSTEGEHARSGDRAAEPRKAERDIAAGERRVTAQELLVERLRRDGHETGEAERLLQNLRQTLEAWRTHREYILQEIARLERDAPG